VLRLDTEMISLGRDAVPGSGSVRRLGPDELISLFSDGLGCSPARAGGRAAVDRER